jgi:hypothetical protein
MCVVGGCVVVMNMRNRFGGLFLKVAKAVCPSGGFGRLGAAFFVAEKLRSQRRFEQLGVRSARARAGTLASQCNEYLYQANGNTYPSYGDHPSHKALKQKKPKKIK